MLRLTISSVVLASLTCIVAHAQQSGSEIRDSVHRKYPDDPLTGTWAANAALEERALKEKSQPRSVAAWAFLGYYAKNTVATPELCRQAGEDINIFVKAFVHEHQTLIEESAKHVSVQDSLAKAQATASADAKSELDRFARAMDTNVKGACRFIGANGVEMARGAHFSKIAPKLYAQLLGADSR